jgi:sigma-B regulation protein RsbU (phosphoserine phosphatase)
LGGFSENTVHLPQGARLIFYSDGITEAGGPGDEEYGAQRLRDLVQRPETSPERLLDDVRAFANGEGLQDDATVIVVKA